MLDITLKIVITFKLMEDAVRIKMHASKKNTPLHKLISSLLKKMSLAYACCGKKCI